MFQIQSYLSFRVAACF